MARELPTGIVRTASGYRTAQWVPDPDRPNGRVRTKRWKSDATVTEMVQWREAQRVDARKPKPVAEQPVVLTGFAADAVTYLEAVRAMPSYTDRARDIGEWIAIFGDTPTAAIAATPIRTARDQWLTVGPKRVLERVTGEKPRWIAKALPLSASTVNHRLRALENFFTVLGKPNPVHEVPEATEPDPMPRGQTFALALEILSFMPDRTSPTKGGTYEPGSLSRVRYETMLWTGLSPVQLARLQPDVHIDWIAGTYLPPRRQKGKHSRRAKRRPDRPRPLLPQAIAALTRFFALGANRRFSNASIGKSVKRAARAANSARAAAGLPLIPPATVRDLTRHTFGTEVFRASKNLKAVQDLMGHADINQTTRYAMAAVTEHTAIAVRQTAARARAGKVGGKVSPVKPSRRDRTRRTPITRKPQ
jgi:integrase